MTQSAREKDGFVAIATDLPVRCRKVLLATGVVDRQPELSHLRELIYRGEVRLCPICDGYEVVGRKVGVLGPIEHAIGKLAFLRTYTRHLTLLPISAQPLKPEHQKWLAEAGITVPPSFITDLRVEGDVITAVFATGEERKVDVLYPAMGADPRSDLLKALHGRTNVDGCIVTDEHQRTTVGGVYAAGDVVHELNKISVAAGHAAIAATHIHNSLREENGEQPPP